MLRFGGKDCKTGLPKIIAHLTNRDLKILDAAAFKNAVTSEGAWVITATFARDIRALRFALCKRSPKHIITNRFGQRITDIRRFYCYDVVQEDQRAFSRIIFG